jgi:hypothetical protein
VQLKGRECGAATAAGVAGLLALFAALCTIFVAAVTFLEWREERAKQDWVPAIAIAERGGLEGSGQSKGSENAPTYFLLRYRVHFEANGRRQVTAVWSHSSPVPEVIDAMQAWAERHGPGSEIAIRFDPARPASAEFDSAQTPNAGSRMDTNFTLLAIAVAGCCVFFPLARFMAARERAQAPAIDAPPSGHSVGWGIFCALLGVLVIGLGGYRALAESADPGPDAVLIVPIGLIFIFAGILIALPPGRENLRRFLGALLITAFAMTFDWVAFGPGERNFSGGVSLGALTVGLGRPGEWLGRAAFGIFALIATVAAIVAWVRLARR